MLCVCDMNGKSINIYSMRNRNNLTTAWPKNQFNCWCIEEDNKAPLRIAKFILLHHLSLSYNRYKCFDANISLVHHHTNAATHTRTHFIFRTTANIHKIIDAWDIQFQDDASVLARISDFITHKIYINNNNNHFDDDINQKSRFT